MAIRDIITYGHPTLKVKSDRVESFDRGLEQLVKDMVDTMHAAPGIGLAANQVDVPLQVAVVDLSVGEDPDSLIILINPEITSREGLQTDNEGCLSIPGMEAKVCRPLHISVHAQDLSGHEFTLNASDLLARAICHEIDHLNGILYVDHLRNLEKRMMLKKLDKQVKSA